MFKLSIFDINICKLKIVTWNCNGALRRKFENLLDFNADIYIIQECENPITTSHGQYQEWAKNHLWIGDTKNKGLGVFASQNIQLKKLDWSNQYEDHSVKYFLPCSVNNEFDLLAIWTHKNNSPNFGYIGQLWKYLQVNKEKLNTTILAGDFNSNAIWDVWDRWWNHSDVVESLKGVGIESFYHKFTGEAQGKETTPTLYLHRNQGKPYHIDYIFGPKKFSGGLKQMTVGSFEKWIQLSDHLPLVCEFDCNYFCEETDFS